MSRVYTANDYASAGNHTGDRLTAYSDDDYEAQILTWIDARLATLTAGLAGLEQNKILIAGCGLGHTLAHLMDSHGFTDVWGCDASAYAIARAQALWPQYASRFIQADVTVRQQVSAVRSAAGLSGNQQFRAVITEDLLPCATDVAEAQAMLTELRRAALGEGHIITMLDPQGVQQPDGSVTYPWGGALQMPGYLWLTAAEWRTLIGNSAWIFTAQGDQVP